MRNAYPTLFLILLYPLLLLGQGISLGNKPQNVTARTSMVSDSGRIIFYYQDRSNPIDTAKLLPRTFDSLTLEATLPVDFFDSVGGLLVDIEVYHRGSGIVSEVLPGTWQHTLSVGGGGGAGSGPNELIVYAIDTTTGDTLSNIDVFVENLTGTPEAQGRTNSSGFATVNVFDGTWIIKAGTNSTIWNFDDTTRTVATTFDTMAIIGYPTVILAPADPAQATVFGFVRDIRNNPDSGIIVSIFLQRINQATGTITIGRKIAVDTTDDLGFFDFNGGIIRSTEYPDSLKGYYFVTGKFNRQVKFSVDTLWIPATGNVDITDEINLR